MSVRFLLPLWEEIREEVIPGWGLDGFGVQGEVSLALKDCSGALRRASPEVAVEALGLLD